MALNSMSLVILVYWSIVWSFAKVVILLVVVCNKYSICCCEKNSTVRDEMGNQIIV